MPSGEYRTIIGLQVKVTTQDEEGNIIQEWRDWKKVWAAVEAMKGMEGSKQFKIRYFSPIPQELRIAYAEKKYHVIEIVDLEGRHRKWSLFCMEVNHGTVR